LPRDKYPNKLVFHDGRLAFRPTFFAALAMYTYLPLGIILAALRCLAFVVLPYRVSIPLAAATGMRSRLVAGPSPDASREKNKAGGRLYVCNHRTLLDPITVAAGLNKPVTAVTYSVSSISELLAPIRTARLTRDRDEDRRRMEALLARGDLVVCPEGTTCREPYLLRFSPLFAEPVLLHDELAAGVPRRVSGARGHRPGGGRRRGCGRTWPQHPSGQPGAARAWRGTRIRAHRAHQEGQVHDAGWE